MRYNVATAISILSWLVDQHAPDSTAHTAMFAARLAGDAA